MLANHVLISQFRIDKPQSKNRWIEHLCERNFVLLVFQKFYPSSQARVTNSSNVLTLTL
jgi:hypothetical protein